MRPLSLCLSAFGPYAETVTIPFEEFNQEGMYLICGDTGAGKTTIFDGLLFALYGKATRDDNTQASHTLRSDFARSSQETYAELYFELHGKTYRVRRNPRYRRAKIHGSGTTEKPAHAELEYPGGRCITGVKEVSDAIEDLLGMSADQFCHIVMIAQGEFRKLLCASTKDRAFLLRKLFDTEHLEAFQNALTSQANALKSESAQYDKDFLSLVADMEYLPTSPEALKCEALQAAPVIDPDEFEQLISLQIKHLQQEQSRLEEEQKAKNVQRDQLQSQLDIYEQRIRYNKQAFDLEQTIVQAKHRLADCRVLREQLALEDESRAQDQKELDQLQLSLPSYDVLAEEQERTKDLQEKIDAAQQDLTTLKARQDKAKARLSQAEAYQEQHKSVPVELMAAEAELTNYEQKHRVLQEEESKLADLERKTHDAHKLEIQISQADKQIQELKHKKLEIEHEFAKHMETARLIPLLQDKLSHAKTELQRLDEKILVQAENLSQLEALEQEQTQSRAALSTAQMSYEKAQAKAESTQATYSKAYRLFLDNQVGMLAEGLVDECPCPVCGSCSHPQPAQSLQAAPTLAQLDTYKEAMDVAHAAYLQQTEQTVQAKTAYEQAEKQLALAYERLGTCHDLQKQNVALKQTKDALCHQIATLSEELATSQTAHHAAQQLEQELQGLATTLEQQIDFSKKLAEEYAHLAGALQEKSASCTYSRERLDTALAEVRQQIQEIQARINALRDQNVTLTQSEEHSKATKLELEQLEQDEQRCTTSLQELHITYAATCEKLQTIRASLSHTSKQEAQARIHQISQALQEHKLKQEHVQKSFEACQRELSELTGSYETHKQQMLALPKPKLEQAQLHTTLQETLANLERLQTELDSIKYKVHHNEDTYEKLKKLRRGYKKLHEQRTSLDILAQTASGNLSNAEKISFETYVQSMYFDKVLERANVRLLHMSEQRYSLLRSEEGSRKGKGNAGLDLDVLDAYTGKKRPAKTLSGGESFKASLALALGLSDVVQSYAGGISLDTMFIDEGFGSLDQESLSRAIKTLLDMNGSNKLVGIISHVSELQDAIDTKIIVTRSQEGSHVRVEY